jgi:hypothetical protein
MTQTQTINKIDSSKSILLDDSVGYLRSSFGVAFKTNEPDFIKARRKEMYNEFMGFF